MGLEDYPAGIVTQTVSAGSSLTLETGELLYTRLTATASRGDLVWYATGQRVTSVGTSNTSALGTECLLTLPVTNQDNVWSTDGNIIRVGGAYPDTDVWTYDFKIEVLRAASSGALDVIKSWDLPGVPLHLDEEGEVFDLDKIIYIPGADTGGVDIPIPDTWTNTVLAAQAQATASAASAAAAAASAQATLDASAATANAAAVAAAAAATTQATNAATSAAASAASAQAAADTVAGWTAAADSSVNTIVGNTGSATRVTLDGLYVQKVAPVLGTADTHVVKQQAVDMETHNRSVTVGYTGSNITSITEKSGATTVKTTTLGYTGTNITTVTEVAGGVTKTTTLAYDGSGNITGTTRS